MNKTPESNKVANLRISALTCRKKDNRSALLLDNLTDYPGYENKWKATGLQLVAWS